jgi:hypothetical protein
VHLATPKLHPAVLKPSLRPAVLTLMLALPCVRPYCIVQGFRIAGKQGIGIIAACQLVLMGGPEYAR